MIIQSLCELYERLAEDPDVDIPLLGYSRQKVGFALVLDEHGDVDVMDLRIVDGKQIRPRLMTLPGGAKPSGQGFHANFMWDNTGYLLGRDGKDNNERAEKAFAVFRDQHLSYRGIIADERYDWFCRFLESWNPTRASTLPHWKDIGNLFMIVGFRDCEKWLHELPEVRALWDKLQMRSKDSTMGQCMISGKIEALDRISPKIKNVRGAQSSGAALVSFDGAAYRSYGKEQNFNAPIGSSSAFKYTTALNLLLDPAFRRKIHIGDATTVYWTAQPTRFESIFGELFETSQDEETISHLAAVLESVRAGTYVEDIGSTDTAFYVLGLSPNAARVSVRFWHVSTVAGMVGNLRAHMDDFSMISSRPNDKPNPPVWMILKEIAAQNDIANIPPQLAGAFMHSVFTGASYPDMLLSAVIRRNRADRQIDRHIRAATTKACLNRKWRLTHTTRKEISMALDTERTDPAYLLGRLFAWLEMAQSNALGTINASIKDRYFGAASSTPASVFPRLLRSAQHHLSKLDTGARIHLEQQLQAIVGVLDSFPAHLNLENQGLFQIGYYHQRQHQYTKKENKD